MRDMSLQVVELYTFLDPLATSGTHRSRHSSRKESRGMVLIQKKGGVLRLSLVLAVLLGVGLAMGACPFAAYAASPTPGAA